METPTETRRVSLTVDVDGMFAYAERMLQTGVQSAADCNMENGLDPACDILLGLHLMLNCCMDEEGETDRERLVAFREHLQKAMEKLTDRRTALNWYGVGEDE